jgi:hypothetical protein
MGSRTRSSDGAGPLDGLLYSLHDMLAGQVVVVEAALVLGTITRNRGKAITASAGLSLGQRT